MKKVWIFCMAMVGAFTACDSDSDTWPKGVRVATGDINDFQIVLVDAYKNLRKELPTMEIVASMTHGDDMFQVYLEDITKKSNKAFADALSQHYPELASIYLKYEGIKGNLKEANYAFSTEDPEDTFLKGIQKKVEAFSASSPGVPLMDQVLAKDGTPLDAVESESISLNFTKIEYALEAASVWLNPSLTTNQQESAMKDILNRELPPVGVALLLPAVQKTREAAKAKEAEEAFILWVEEEVVPISGGLDRDLIRRKWFYEMLGSLNIIISQNAPHANQWEAAVSAAKARFDIKVWSIAMDAWNAEPAQ
jgi:hypothetical protein